MASHLTITTANAAGVSSTKGSGAPAGASPEAEGGILGVFAALLGAANQTTVKASAEASTDLSLGNLINLSFGASLDGEQGDETADPDAIAAAIDATLPIQASIDAKPALTDLINGLAELSQSLEAGDAVDPELLKRLDTALTDLAEQFDVDLSALPSLDDLKAITSTILPDDTSVEAQLTLALAPLAETLLSGTADTELSADVELPTLVKSIGEKLAALLTTLNGDDVDPAMLATLSLDAETPADAELEAAIARLVAPPAIKVDASAAAQVLATPELKLTEPVLSGKVATDASVKTDSSPLQVAAIAPDDAAADNKDGNSSPGDEKKPGTTGNPTTVAVAATTENALPDPQSSTLTTHQASRIDAAAARPVVQAGYQTSQQQLNLPQLAFELVRQVNDGNTRFQMRLDPPELGRIDVRLDIDAAGKVNARLIVDRAETLDLMQRDQRGLERALQQAGLDSAKTNLEFSLKQNPFSGGNQQGQDGGDRQPRFSGATGPETEDTPAPTVTLYRGSLTASGLNIIA